MNNLNHTDIKLSIVIAVYSETSSLIETVGRLLENNRGYINEILLVISPRSSKECFDTCRQLTQQHNFIKIHIQENNPGLGWAFREGMKMANGTHVAIMSGDLETEPEAIDRMVHKIEETNCDVVIGSRWMKGGGFTGYDSFKLVLNWIFQQWFSLIYLTKVGDLTYGFKILKKAVIDTIDWKSTLHEICIETTLRPLLKGYYIEQIPTRWVGRIEGASKNTFFKNFRYVKLAIKLRLGF